MTKLKSLTLSNVRRFSEDAKIEFGESATIIIAPNGTGKTSIFEAIEFILTGKVSRLTKLETLVRDKQRQATIGIEFSCKANKIATITNEGKTDVLGDLTSVLNKTAPEDLPYLLRLTHMLDQRGGNWFVQSDTAGAQLNKLPIGRDAASANKLMTSAKRAANLHQKDVSRDLLEAQEKLNNLQGLVDKKRVIEKSYKQPLISIQGLIGGLNGIATNLNYEGRILEENLLEIKDFIIQLASKIEIKYLGETKRINSLVEIKPIVENYLDLSSKRKLVTDKKSEFKNIILAAKKRVQEKQLEEENINKSCEIMLDELNSLRITMKKIEKYNKFKDEVDLIKQNIILVDSKISESEKNEMAVKAKYSGQLDLQSKHVLTNKSLDLLVSEEVISNKVKENLLILKVLNKEEIEIKKSHVLSESKVSLCADTVQSRINQKNIVKSELEKEELHLSHLTKTSDSIRSAVSIIASELPKNQDDCPVCGEHHGFDELYRRVGVELEKIDPTITLITDNVLKLRTNLKAKERLVIEANEEQAKLASLNVKSNRLITNLELRISKLIDDLILPVRFSDLLQKIKRFAIEKNIQGAEIALESSTANIIEERSKVALQKSNLDPVSISDIEKLKEDLRLSEFKVRDLKSSRGESKRTLEQNKNELNRNVVTDIDRLKVKDISNKERKLNETKILSLPITDELERIRLIIDRALKDNQQNQFLIDEYSTVINKTKAAWISLELLGEPDLENIIVYIANVNERREVIGECKQILNSIQTEVARWDENKQFVDLKKSIDSIRGEVEETIFLGSLLFETKQLKTKIDEINQKLSTLELFSHKLANELKNIDGRIKDIEPVWRSLLSRIVLDPRYSQTGLDISTKYNKPIATISAPLHNSVTSVNMLASEAQITDLQLTFLMAMAQKQSWSPWRALLLDDPTQHHDLVHSSSVFDLLRDFIVEDGFQLVLTTHDKVQANFLRRKLENDGIPVTICQLQATEHGVISNELLV